MKTSIGIIGVGLMGHGIAMNIARCGWPLAYLAHAGNQDTQGLDQLGGKAHTTARSLAEHSDVIILCVTGSPQVEAVMFADDGVLDGIRNGATVIDCSTAIPSSTQKVATAVADAGCHFLDAPMTRTPREAAEGRLNLIVGGKQEVLEEHRSLLESFAENITHVGDIGAGHTLKLIHNFVSLGYSALLSEAAACASKAGIAEDVFIEVLGKGGGGGVVLDRLAPYLRSGDSSGFRFSLANSFKDLSYYVSMTEDLEAYNQTALSIKEVFAETSARSRLGTPLPELVDLLKEGPKQ